MLKAFFIQPICILVSSLSHLFAKFELVCQLLVTAGKRSLGKVIFLHLSCHSVHRGWSTWPGTPPLGRYTLGRYPPGQVHPLAGTPPRQVHLPWARYTPLAGTPPWQVTPPPRSSSCWEIWATSGRYASYWNAFLYLTYNF